MSIEKKSGSKRKRNVTNIRRRVLQILKQHDVKRAALFGSFARGENTAHSDLDLLIEFKGQKSLFDLVGLKLALEAKIHRKVDVVTYRALHPALREQILGEQIIVLPA
ncbi:MAG: nucleotidyltransferase family protein [Chloroflexi bacterium]|nr:nucleotidyltransferase family protein [Chloroflexota bacterium]